MLDVRSPTLDAIFTNCSDGIVIAQARHRKLEQCEKGLILSSLWAGCAMLLAARSGQPLSIRENGGLTGGASGAGSGAIMGAAVGHPWASAAIGAPVGLITGATIGDSLMGLE